jgi:photosynthetic reaction center cytochrome c subunit
MKFGSSRNILPLVTMVAVSLLNVASTSAQTQTGTAQKPLLAEEAFKNVQVLRGIPASEFMETMGFFAVSLTANCTTCHGDDSACSWAKYAVDTPLKLMSRKMVVMVNLINQTNFGGKREVTCYTCHHGNMIPRVTPTMADVYAASFAPVEPDKILPPAKGGPTVDQIINKYITALGGAEKLAKVTSLVAKGTSQAYAEDKYPVEIYAKAPNQFATVVTTESGLRTTTFDGTDGWVATLADDKPVPLLPMIQGDLLGAKLDAELVFPAKIKQYLMDLHVTNESTIDDKDVEVLQGTLDGKTPVNLYFDPKTGLLVREVHYNDTKVGLAATQTDYKDYRLLPTAGIKVPFHTTVSWLDGQTNYILTQVLPNARIDPAKFAKPAQPKPSTTP